MLMTRNREYLPRLNESWDLSVFTNTINDVHEEGLHLAIDTACSPNVGERRREGRRSWAQTSKHRDLPSRFLLAARSSLFFVQARVR